MSQDAANASTSKAVNFKSDNVVKSEPHEHKWRNLVVLSAHIPCQLGRIHHTVNFHIIKQVNYTTSF